MTKHGGSHPHGATTLALVTRVCETCVRVLLVEGAAVSVAAVSAGGEAVFATNTVARRLDDLQFELGEGPSFDALATNGPVLIRDITAASPRRRWPAFATAAAECGAVGLWTFPLVIGAVKVGVLAMYRVEAGVPDGAVLTQALRLADVATLALLEFPSDDPHGQSQLNTESNYDADGFDGSFHRAEVYQASGVLSVQLGVGLDVALARLRAHAFAVERPLLDVSRDVIAHTLRLEPDNA